MSYQPLQDTSVQDFTDDEGSPLYPFGKPVFLSDLSVQMAFVRKVWVIFTGELVMVTAITALFIYMNVLRSFVNDYWWILWISFFASFFLLIALTYKSNDDFQPPWYLVILYACSCAYTVGGTVAYFQLFFVLDALILILVACLSVLAFTNQTAYKFRAKEPLILTSSLIIIVSFALHPWLFSFSELIPAVILALFLNIYFILDTWYLMRQMNKDEYWGASMQLYLDLVVPFRTIHHMCELTAEYGDDYD